MKLEKTPARPWYLSDASETQRSFPYTFFRTSDKTIGKLVAGDLVKLIFLPEGESNGGERMWVSITEVTKDRFFGTVENDALNPRFPKYREVVEFEPKHIIMVDMKAKDDADEDNQPSYWERCFVSRKVLYDGVRVGYIFREAPEDEMDSGWRIFAGDESEEYTADSENIFYVALGAVLNRDDSFLSLLESETGSQFERDDATGEFRAVTDE